VVVARPSPRVALSNHLGARLLWDDLHIGLAVNPRLQKDAEATDQTRGCRVSGPVNARTPRNGLPRGGKRLRPLQMSLRAGCRVQGRPVDFPELHGSRIPVRVPKYHNEESMRRWSAACSTFAVLVLGASNANAECARRTATSVLSHALVFRGTVLQLTNTGPQGVRVTFDVDRVWKGSVTRRFDVYVSWRQSEIPYFETGQRHLVIADPQTDPERRQAVGIDEKNTLAYFPVRCSDRASLVRTIESDLGAGSPPQR